MLSPPLKSELIFIGATLFLLISLVLVNFQSATVKSRDNQRKNDLKRMYQALDVYITDVGNFPPAKDGLIVACGDPLSPTPCDWNKDPLASTDDAGNRRVYQDLIPQDPRQADGYTYVYFSDNHQYQILTHLESEDDPEFKLEVKARHISCGPGICNYGVASSGTSLDKSVEDQPKPQALP